MELVLWRHADAEDGVPDLERPLTAKGRKQAARMARWLEDRLPARYRLLASPARRAQETARALPGKIHTVDGLAPGADPKDIVKAAGWPGADGTVVVVGHQPGLGLAAALLLAGKPHPWSLRKGAICWLVYRSGDESAVVLKALLSPDLL